MIFVILPRIYLPVLLSSRRVRIVIIMKCRIGIILSLMLLLATATCFSQVAVHRSTEIATVSGHQYYMHHVEDGQTLYGISRAYNVSVDEITALNPEISSGLKSGTVIGIPVREENEASKSSESRNSVGNDNAKRHLVAKGETIYGISHKYGVTEQELVSMNPGIESGLREGQTLVIPSHAQNGASPAVSVSTGGGWGSGSAQKPYDVRKAGEYVVGDDESIYVIAKKFCIDVSVIRAANPGISDYPDKGVRINIPDVVYNESYLVHEVVESERTTTLLRKWEVDDDLFRNLNPSVGVRVFKGQKVLIPVDPVLPADDPDDHREEVIITEEPTPDLVTDMPSMVEIPTLPTFECHPSTDNNRKTYHVALLVPLYLDEISNVAVSASSAKQSNGSRPLSFIQYYEGFMMAVDSLTDYCGLHLDLTVIDVDESVAKAERAVSQLSDKDVDLIIGPFFKNAFVTVQNYALSKNIVIVNPLSKRDNVTLNAPNVVRIKPDEESKPVLLGNLVRNYFENPKVCIVSPKSSVAVDDLEYVLNLAVNAGPNVTNSEFVRGAEEVLLRREYYRSISTLGDSTNASPETQTDTTFFAHRIGRYTSTSSFREQLQGSGDNVMVAYSTNYVSAVQILNSINKSAGKRRVTLVGLPDWESYDNLLVENLLNVNAIFVSDFFVDYNSPRIKSFTMDFKGKYGCYPKNYAFEGYDVGLYFLTALMEFGPDMIDCLPDYHPQLMHTQFYFGKTKAQDGLENLYWSFYQYDKETIEYKPIGSNYIIGD